MLACRKDIVGPARNLQHLDGTRVLKQERLFLQQLHARKLSRDISSRRTSQAHLLRARQMLVGHCSALIHRLLCCKMDVSSFCQFRLMLVDHPMQPDMMLIC